MYLRIKDSREEADMLKCMVWMYLDDVSRLGIADLYRADGVTSHEGSIVALQVFSDNR